MCKAIFHHLGKFSELCVGNVRRNATPGLVEVAQPAFGKKSPAATGLSEEDVKSEFNHIVRAYAPMRSIIRIDEADKQGAVRITGGDKMGADVAAPVPAGAGGGEDIN